MIILALLFLISFVINIFLLWYVRWALSNLVFVSNNIGKLLDDSQDYLDHLESIFELEMFYGDETIQGLLDHTKSLIKEINKFQDVHALTGPEEDQEYDGETEVETEDSEETQKEDQELLLHKEA